MMVKKIVLGAIAVFVAWEVLDFIIHGLILGPTYATLPGVFRSPADMNYVLMAVAALLGAVAFTASYGWFVGPKSVVTGVKFGLVWGFGAGVMMGYGSYSSMPIPYFMALIWFLGTWLEFVVAGALTGLIVKPAAA